MGRIKEKEKEKGNSIYEDDVNFRCVKMMNIIINDGEMLSRSLGEREREREAEREGRERDKSVVEIVINFVTDARIFGEAKSVLRNSTEYSVEYLGCRER